MGSLGNIGRGQKRVQATDDFNWCSSPRPVLVWGAEFADHVGMRLRLIDGRELTKLMVRYNVGAEVRETFDLKQIDEE